jgi:formate dehydrogenase major subunit
MKVTRRQFFKVTGASAAALAVADLGFNLEAAASEVRTLRIKNVKGIPTICPYCASGCGLLVYSERDASGKFIKLLSVEGDPDNPINRGGACAKGSSMFNLREIYDPENGEQKINPKRAQVPLYRAPGSDKWVEKDWEWMMAEIAKRVKDTRDSSFLAKEKLADGSEITVNRTEKIASIGGSGLDNEEAYLWSKLARAMGIVYLETQARI